MGELGHKVLVADLDPQRSASRWFGVGDESIHPTLADVLAGEPPDVDAMVRTSSAANVDVIPADDDLATVHARLRVQATGGVRLRRLLESAPGPYDIALIDCPPTVGFLVAAGITAADTVLVPVEATIMATQGLGDMLTLLEDLREATGRALPVLGIVPVRVKTGTNLGRGLVEGLQEAHRGVVTDTTIRDTVRLAEAPHSAQAITDYDPDGAGAADYRALAAELHERITEAS